MVRVGRVSRIVDGGSDERFGSRGRAFEAFVTRNAVAIVDVVPNEPMGNPGKCPDDAGLGGHPGRLGRKGVT